MSHPKWGMLRGGVWYPRIPVTGGKFIDDPVNTIPQAEYEDNGQPILEGFNFLLWPVLCNEGRVNANLFCCGTPTPPVTPCLCCPDLVPLTSLVFFATIASNACPCLDGKRVAFHYTTTPISAGYNPVWTTGGQLTCNGGLITFELALTGCTWDLFEYCTDHNFAYHIIQECMCNTPPLTGTVVKNTGVDPFCCVGTPDPFLPPGASLTVTFDDWTARPCHLPISATATITATSGSFPCTVAIGLTTPVATASGCGNCQDVPVESNFIAAFTGVGSDPHFWRLSCAIACNDDGTATAFLTLEFFNAALRDLCLVGTQVVFPQSVRPFSGTVTMNCTGCVPIVSGGNDCVNCSFTVLVSSD